MQQHLPFTVLKLVKETNTVVSFSNFVATALTVYGIETRHLRHSTLSVIILLQQHLPFTVLKQPKLRANVVTVFMIMLQQHLPFTVLKQPDTKNSFVVVIVMSCNSTYRLRY